jgi:hypothetical protein
MKTIHLVLCAFGLHKFSWDTSWIKPYKIGRCQCCGKTVIDRKRSLKYK